MRSVANSLRRLVGAWRFELQTSCAQGNNRNTILLTRLALFCVVVPGFGPNLALVGPMLDLTFFGATRQAAGRRSLDSEVVRGLMASEMKLTSAYTSDAAPWSVTVYIFQCETWASLAHQNGVQQRNRPAASPFSSVRIA
jgi:hypothetical protein